MYRTRRAVLTTGAAAFAGVPIAGCTAPELSGGADDPSGFAAFFALVDWCRAVGSDELTFETPVPVGRVGHGHDPAGDLVRDIAETTVFVYLDTPEFAWAQDVAGELRRDYPDVTIIDGLTGFTRDRLLSFDADVDATPDRDHDWNPETLTIGDVHLVDRNVGEVTAEWHVDHWDGGIPAIPLDRAVSLEAIIQDDEGRVLPLGEGEPYQLDVSVAEGATTAIIETESRGDRLELVGATVGETAIVLQVTDDEAVLWESDADTLAVEVVAELEPTGVGAFHDPHVWVDPILAQLIVDTIADGLAEVIPDAADSFEANAATYNERLGDVDEGFRSLVADAERTTAVFAGHDSFRYPSHRYGFELHTPAGVSPDQRPSQREIADTVELIEREGIDTILYDPFETPDPGESVPPMAETLVESSPATDLAPLTAVEGTTAEWNEAGWGWVEQMEELNLPSLRRALGAT